MQKIARRRNISSSLGQQPEVVEGAALPTTVAIQLVNRQRFLKMCVGLFQFSTSPKRLAQVSQTVSSG